MWGTRTVLAAVVGAALLSAPAASADGPVGPDPAQNFPTGVWPQACFTQPEGAVCQNAAIYYLDQARASLGQPPYALPANFTTLSPVDQDLILTDLDRTLVGLPPVPGDTAALDADATTGVADDADPVPTEPNVLGATSNWAGGYLNLEAAYEGWMYDDGPGSANLDCTTADPSGCWGHRHDILWSFGGAGPLAMGAAQGVDPSGQPGYAMLIEQTSGSAPAYTDTWAAAESDGAGTNTYSVSAPGADVEVTVVGAGVVSDGNGQTCTSAAGCTFSEPIGRAVTLTASPTAGATFEQWTGACTGTGACQLTPGQNGATVTAQFSTGSTTTTGGGGSGGGGSGGGSGGTGTGGTSGSGGSGGTSGGGSSGGGNSGGGTGGGGTGGGSSGTAPSSTSTSAARTPQILTMVSSTAAIRATLRGSALTCTLTRRAAGRWELIRVAHCGTTVSYRHLLAGRYRLSVRSRTSGRATRRVIWVARPTASPSVRVPIG